MLCHLAGTVRCSAAFSAQEPSPALPVDEDVVVRSILSSSALIVLRVHLMFKKALSAIFVLCCR